jgi:flap endonuclease-1
MGLKIKDILIKEEITFKDLKGKILAVDSMNILYQFLTTIRGPTGLTLTNSKGDVTSHLIGLFNRTTSLMQEGMKLCFVFDGKAPDLKTQTKDARAALKQEASVLLKKAQEAGDENAMRKYSARTVVLTKDMVREAKELITLLGLPIIQAPSEGEAQTAYMSKKGDVYASVSQDYDNLVFGCSRLIRNLSIAGRRKKTSTLAYETIKPDMLSLEKNLQHMEIDLDQLIVIAILVGTDYNPKGVKGIGQKTALKLVKEYNGKFDELFEKVEWDTQNDISWKEIFDVIKQIPVTDEYTLEWKPVQYEKLVEFLVEKHEFSEDRVKTKLDKLVANKEKLSQTGLGSFM